MGQVSTSAYSSVSISGYNASPPPDDGSQTAANQLQWSKHKTKLADPIKTLSEGINTAVVSAFAKTINTDAAVANQISGALAFELATATIGTDSITPNASFIAVGAQGGATADTLQVLDPTDIYHGTLLWLRARHATEEITVVHATSTLATATGANIFLATSDYVMNDTNRMILMQYDSTATGWREVTRSHLAIVDEIVQEQRTDDSAVSTTTTTIPLDDTIPTATEGALFITATIAPTAVGNILEIEGNLMVSFNGNGTVIGGLFQGAATAATKVLAQTVSISGGISTVPVRHRTAATSTTATSWTVRMGGAGAGTVTFNGSAGSRTFGGAAASYLRILERLPT